MFIYQEENRYFAQMHGGFEEFVVPELKKFGAEVLEVSGRGVSFKADFNTVVKINYYARYITRILAPLKEFECKDPDKLYEEAKKIDWTSFFTTIHTFKIYSNVLDSEITHSQYAGLRVKDAVADFFMEKYGKRPNVGKKNPDIIINVFIKENQASINVDLSGDSLHKRGYRRNSVTAPIQETLAAAIIASAEWDKRTKIYDPMCGSGTILAESLMEYCNVPSGYLKESWGFEFFPEFDLEYFEQLKKEAMNNFKNIPYGFVSGSDIDAKNANTCKKNLNTLPFGDKVKIKTTDFRKLPPKPNHLIITNPPYGVRLGEVEELKQFYKDFGDYLKQKCKGSTAYIYCGVPELIKYFRLKPSWHKNINNGGLKGRLIKLEMY